MRLCQVRRMAHSITLIADGVYLWAMWSLFGQPRRAATGKTKPSMDVRELSLLALEFPSGTGIRGEIMRRLRARLAQCGKASEKW